MAVSISTHQSRGGKTQIRACRDWWEDLMAGTRNVCLAVSMDDVRSELQHMKSACAEELQADAADLPASPTTNTYAGEVCVSVWVVSCQRIPVSIERGLSIKDLVIVGGALNLCELVIECHPARPQKPLLTRELVMPP
eukprot:6382110-Amphidinium_carterae.1